MVVWSLNGKRKLVLKGPVSCQDCALDPRQERHAAYRVLRKKQNKILLGLANNTNGL